jgi:hypothetical protein
MSLSLFSRVVYSPYPFTGPAAAGAEEAPNAAATAAAGSTTKDESDDDEFFDALPGPPDSNNSAGEANADRLDLFSAKYAAALGYTPLPPIGAAVARALRSAAVTAEPQTTATRSGPGSPLGLVAAPEAAPAVGQLLVPEDVPPANADRLDVFRVKHPGTRGFMDAERVAAVEAAVRAIPLALGAEAHAAQLAVAPTDAPLASAGEREKKGRKRKKSAGPVQHPSGNFFQVMPLPTLAGPLAMLRAVQNNVSSFMWESVVESSRKTYRTGLNHFIEYTAMIGSDQRLSKIPKEFHQLQQPQPLSWFLMAMLGFLTYLRVNVEVTPGTVATYCSGVRFFLLNSFVDVSEMDTSVVMKAVRAGMHKAWRALPGNAKSDRDTLPYSADMLVRVRNELCHSATPERQSRKELALATAIVFGFILLARISEYIVTASDHYIRGKHILFVLRSGAVIDASQAYLHSIADVVEMYATIKDSKNDPDGMGHRFTYGKMPADSTCLLCIVTEMFRCASVLRPTREGAFFAWGGDRNEGAWSLGQHAVNRVLKDGAILFGFDPDKISSHSLRIGGASALAAAGAPSWVIQLTGRWKSLAFLMYIRLASAAFQRSIEMQTDGTTFTAKHIEQWNPAAARPVDVIVG